MRIFRRNLTVLLVFVSKSTLRSPDKKFYLRPTSIKFSERNFPNLSGCVTKDLYANLEYQHKEFSFT